MAAYGSAKEMRHRMGASDDDEDDERGSPGRKSFGNEKGKSDGDEDDFPRGRGERARGAEKGDGPSGSAEKERGALIKSGAGPHGKGVVEEDEEEKGHDGAKGKGGRGVDLSKPSGHDLGGSGTLSESRTAILSNTGKGLPPPPTATPLAAHAMNSPQDAPGAGPGLGKAGPQPMKGQTAPKGTGGGMVMSRGGLSDEDLLRALSRNVSSSIGQGTRNLR